jgi:hypothetical protein
MTIVDPATSSSSWTTIIPIMGTLAGVAAGFLANEASHLIRTKREDRNVLGRTLSDLLEIRHHLRAIPEVIGLVRSRFPAALPTEVNFGMRQILRALLPDIAALSKRFDEAVSGVAGPFPLLAFELRSKDALSRALAILASFGASDVKAQAVLVDVEDMMIRSTLPVLNDLILRTAKMHSRNTLEETKQSLVRQFELPKEADQVVTHLFKTAVEAMKSAANVPGATPPPAPAS